MGWWRVSADTLAKSRFVISPLAEVVACLITLERSISGDPAGKAWLDRHQPPYQAFLERNQVTKSLAKALFRPGWITDFVSPPPVGDGDSDFKSELEMVLGVSSDEAHEDLRATLGGSIPDALDRDDLPQLAAELLTWVWESTVLPYWPRRARVLEAETVARTAQIAQQGWAAAVDDMRPGMQWLGDGRLQVNAHDYPPKEIPDARLFFVPVTPRAGWVTWRVVPHRYAVIYPCSGVLAQTGTDTAPPAALSALVGPWRATILTLVETPMSTTQLVALTGQSLGSVGRHLKILLDAKLVDRRRAGRSVLYYRTETGDSLISTQRP